MGTNDDERHRVAAPFSLGEVCDVSKFNASLGITMTFCNGQLDLIVLDWSFSTVAFVWAPFDVLFPCILL